MNRNKLALGLIGAGNMGEAFLKGLSSSLSIFIVESDLTKIARLKKSYALQAVSLSDLMAKCDVIILAVKPQDMEGVLQSLKAINTKKSPLFISIAAGLTLSYFKNILGPQARIIRCMPNMPAFIGKAVSGYCLGAKVSKQDAACAKYILDAIGQSILVEEKMMNALTAVSGSGPAYVFLLAEFWIAAAIDLGFSPKQAQDLVYGTLIGSAELLKQSSFSAGELREKVTSKGGTTAAALKIMNTLKQKALFSKALQHAANRAQELAK